MFRTMQNIIQKQPVVSSRMFESYSRSIPQTVYAICGQSNYVSRICQVMTLSGSHKINKVQFHLIKSGNPTGNMYAHIYESIYGTVGSTGRPTGSSSATSNTVDVSTLNTSFPSGVTLVDFDFQTPLTCSGNIGVCFEYSGGDINNSAAICHDPSNDYPYQSRDHSGNLAYLLNSNWNYYGNQDLFFNLFEEIMVY